MEKYTTYNTETKLYTEYSFPEGYEAPEIDKFVEATMHVEARTGHSIVAHMTSEYYRKLTESEVNDKAIMGERLVTGIPVFINDNQKFELLIVTEERLGK